METDLANSIPKPVHIENPSFDSRGELDMDCSRRLAQQVCCSRRSLFCGAVFGTNSDGA